MITISTISSSTKKTRINLSVKCIFKSITYNYKEKSNCLKETLSEILSTIQTLTIFKITMNKIRQAAFGFFFYLYSPWKDLHTTHDKHPWHTYFPSCNLDQVFVENESNIKYAKNILYPFRLRMI